MLKLSIARPMLIFLSCCRVCSVSVGLVINVVSVSSSSSWCGGSFEFVNVFWMECISC